MSRRTIATFMDKLRNTVSLPKIGASIAIACSLSLWFCPRSNDEWTVLDIVVMLLFTTIGATAAHLCYNRYGRIFLLWHLRHVCRPRSYLDEYRLNRRCLSNWDHVQVVRELTSETFHGAIIRANLPTDILKLVIEYSGNCPVPQFLRRLACRPSALPKDTDNDVSEMDTLKRKRRMFREYLAAPPEDRPPILRINDAYYSISLAVEDDGGVSVDVPGDSKYKIRVEVAGRRGDEQCHVLRHYRVHWTFPCYDVFWIRNKLYVARQRNSRTIEIATCSVLNDWISSGGGELYSAESTSWITERIIELPRDVDQVGARTSFSVITCNDETTYIVFEHGLYRVDMATSILVQVSNHDWSDSWQGAYVMMDRFIVFVTSGTPIIIDPQDCYMFEAKRLVFDTRRQCWYTVVTGSPSDRPEFRAYFQWLHVIVDHDLQKKERTSFLAHAYDESTKSIWFSEAAIISKVSSAFPSGGGLDAPLALFKPVWYPSTFYNRFLSKGHTFNHEIWPSHL